MLALNPEPLNGGLHSGNKVLGYVVIVVYP